MAACRRGSIVSMSTGGALIASLGAGAAVAQAPSASFTARDFAWEVTGSTRTAVTVNLGATVTFTYPTGTNAHNARFDRTGVRCTQTAGTGTATDAIVVPASAEGPGWSADCTFDQPGTYTFVCDPHDFMTGTVSVIDPNAPAPSPTGPAPTPVAPGTTPAPAGPAPGPPSPAAVVPPPPATIPAAPSSLPRATIARTQRGTLVKGRVTRAAARGRVIAEVTARRRDVGAGRARSTRIRVARAVRRASTTGTVSFSARLDARARRALTRRGRLALQVRVRIARRDGGTRTVTRNVTLRAPRR